MRPLSAAAMALLLASPLFALDAPKPPATPEEIAASKARRRTEHREDLRKMRGMVERAGLSRSVLQEGSAQGMNWSDEDVLFLGPFIANASDAVRKLHEGNKSNAANVGWGGTTANIEDFFRAVTFTTGEDDQFARGCKSHQATTFIAVRSMGSANDRDSPLEVHKIRVQRKLFTHNAVIVYPNGTDWKKNGVVLDAWIKQSYLPDEMTYYMRDWYGKADFAARLLPDDD